MMCVIIEGIEYHHQKDKQHCGPTVASMAISKFGTIMDQDQIADAIMKVRTDGYRNAFTYDICGFLTDNGFYPEYYIGLSDEKAWGILMQNINNGNPVIVSQRYSRKISTGHFRLVIGYHDIKKKFLVVYNDPHDGPKESMEKDRFLELWKPNGSQDILTSNEMVIIKNSKSSTQISRCISCNSEQLETTDIDFYHRRPEYHFINTKTRINCTCTQITCLDCNARIAFFQN